MRRLLLLTAAALMLATAAALPVKGQGEEKENVLADELRLKNAYQSTDGESLVAFLSTRAKGAIEPKELDTLIEKLESKDAGERQKACQKLIAIGEPAIPKLRLAARDPDASETATLAKKLLAVLKEEPSNVTGAAIRLLVARRPKGTAEALLAHLPHAEDERMLEEIKTALANVAYEKGKADPSMLKALEDDHPMRRAAAITALCTGGIGEHRDALRKLLTDKSPSVRLQAAMALSQASDAKAVSTLISLLGDLAEEQGRQVESFLMELAGDQAPKVTYASDDISKQKARDAWAKWWLDSDGPALIKELEKRTLTEELMAKANGLIEKLGDDVFETRKQAEDDLKKMGPMIMPLLKTALKNPDLEIRNRSQKILALFENNPNTPLSMTVPRLIALRKPKGAVEAILNYLPFAEEESVIDELQNGLNAVAYPNGKASPALVKALTDKIAVRRAAAGAALANGPIGDNMDAVRKLLKDKDVGVRLRVALALAGAREPEAVPALISIVNEGSYDQVNAAEDYLFRLARETPPKDLPEGDEKKKDRAEAWEKWWDDNKKTVAMVDKFSTDARKPYLGYITLVQQNNGQIVEMDRNFKPRVTIRGLSYPWDVQWLNNDRVLIAEYNAMKVTERDKTGKVLWEHKLNFYPMQVERLRNGNTFIVGQNFIVEVDRNKKEVWKYDRNNFHDIRTARRLPNGQIVILDQNGQMKRLDKTGKQELSTARLTTYYYQNEILDNGNIIVPLGYMNKVVEYDSKGKAVLELKTNQPMHAVRLPNRNTLVMSQNFPYKVIELNKDSKVVREHATNTYLFRIKSR